MVFRVIEVAVGPAEFAVVAEGLRKSYGRTRALDGLEDMRYDAAKGR
jgi:hypothetical protein